VIVTRDDGTMERIVEKPSEPISRLANIGVYYIRDYELLFEGIHRVLDTEPGKGGEFYLTDAFQYMVDQGARLRVAPVAGWYDCGKAETVLETNRHLLEAGRAGVADDAVLEDVTIVDPVRVEAGARVLGGRLGPNVTVERGAAVVRCELAHTIVGAEADLERCRLDHSLVGARAHLRGLEGRVRLADDSVVEGG
jgi:glucose-1-phosphate thymidylyltransferase